MTSAAGYKALREKVGLRESDLTLTVNTDGSPLFESSKTSVWPVQFVINELPPRKRFSNCTLAGLWCSKSHPDMSVFLSEFVTEVNSMEPVLWEEDGCKPSSRSFVLCCAVDAPARAAVLNMKQHNGYSSCTWCLITCSYVDNCVRYISSQPVEQRTSELLVRDGELSLELDTDINGVKGPTPMMYLPGFDLVRGCSVEYMHSVLLGVARQLNDHLFGSSHSVERYYIGSRAHMSKINGLLLWIKPPHCITRLPRSLTDRVHWKASELRNWLLYYSLPCTVDILPREYWRHLAKLSEAVHILLREEIAEEDISHADEHLDTFVRRCVPLYGKSFMTFNVHALLHFAESVRFLGPLWAHSAFVFEGGNGKLVNLVSAAKGAPQQITERVIMHHLELETVLAVGSLRAEEMAACERLLGCTRLQNAFYDGNVCMLGHSHTGRLSSTELDAIERFLNCKPASIMEHDRFIFGTQVFHSSSYSRPSKSDSTVFVSSGGAYYKIEKVVKVCTGASPKCLLVCRSIVVCVSSCVYPPHIKSAFSPSVKKYIFYNLRA
ncbi:uncharacterized protein LOC135370543 [Ornithodoros turicata]|uniref:uncharacterized protein LOC135370543 n=1 Tax=Ornithodoros turicata TaxID=34597 RepID=UPI0031398AE4